MIRPNEGLCTSMQISQRGPKLPASAGEKGGPRGSLVPSVPPVSSRTPFHPQTGLIRRRVRNTVAVIVFQPSVHLSAESEAFNLSLLLFGRSLRRSRETGAMISNIDPKWGGPRRRRKESLSRCLGDFDAGHSLLKERDILLA